MKTLTALAALLTSFAAYTAQAQTITAQHLPAAGTRHNLAVTRPLAGTGASLDMTAGTHKTWDMSQFSVAQPGDQDFLGYDTVVYASADNMPQVNKYAGTSHGTLTYNGQPQPFNRYYKAGIDGLYELGGIQRQTYSSHGFDYISLWQHTVTNPSMLLPLPLKPGRITNSQSQSSLTHAYRKSQNGKAVIDQTFKTSTTRHDHIQVLADGQLTLPGANIPVAVVAVMRQTISHDTLYELVASQWQMVPRDPQRENPRIDTSLTIEYYSTNGDFQVATATIDRQKMIPTQVRFVANANLPSPLKPNMSRTAIATWPVPAFDYVNVEMPEEATSFGATIDIIGSDGRQLQHNVAPGNASTRIDLGGLPRGIYHFRLLSQGQLLGTGRFVAQ